MPTIDPNSTQRRTSLQLFNAVLGELGLSPTGSILSSDETVSQLLHLVNGFGSRLARMPFWSELVEEHSFTTTTATSYNLPIDWGIPLAGTQWDRSSSWPLVGPMTPTGWQVLLSGVSTATPRIHYRYKGNQLVFHEAPEAGIEIVQEYLSTGWVLGLNGATATQRKPRFSADTDYILFDEEMFICGAKLVWLEAKGLDSTKALETFKQMLEAGWSASAGAEILSYDKSPRDALLSYANVPEAGFGS